MLKISGAFVLRQTAVKFGATRTVRLISARNLPSGETDTAVTTLVTANFSAADGAAEIGVARSKSTSSAKILICDLLSFQQR